MSSVSTFLKLLFYASSQLTFGITTRKNKEILKKYSTITSVLASTFIAVFFSFFSFYMKEELRFLFYRAMRILLVMCLLFMSGKLFVKHQCNLSATVASVFNQPPTIFVMYILEKTFMKKKSNIYQNMGLILLVASFVLLSFIKEEKKEEKINKIEDCLFLLLASLLRGLGNFLFNYFVLDEKIKKSFCSYALTAHSLNALVGSVYFGAFERRKIVFSNALFLVSFVQGFFFSSIMLLTIIFIASDRFIYTSVIHLINDFLIDFYLGNRFLAKRVFLYFVFFVGFLFYKNEEITKFFGK